jgi:ketosteroid isomerase-like protein
MCQEETMQPSHQAAHLAALGREWVAAWNSHDLERVLALYAEDSEMTSDKIQALALTPAERCAARPAFAPTGEKHSGFCPICISI